MVCSVLAVVSFNARMAVVVVLVAEAKVASVIEIGAWLYENWVFFRSNTLEAHATTWKLITS